MQVAGPLQTPESSPRKTMSYPFGLCTLPPGAVARSGFVTSTSSGKLAWGPPTTPAPTVIVRWREKVP